MSKLSQATKRALLKYGKDACIVAYFRHITDGEGAATIALTGPAVLKTTRQADAAINAGREIVTLHNAGEGGK